MKYRIFDNNGETLDRYTVIDNEGDMIGMSDDPTHPLGFSQFCGNVVDNYMNVSFGYSWRRHCDVEKNIRHHLPRLVKEFEQEGTLGKRIRFADLPKNIQQHIRERFTPCQE
jgi:hypothetical protein